ncbi:MAG: transport system periplasmic substrate binding protein [Gammaproteobacteria bacterium]|jgi:phospholipid/cholesterol/gamma-HCH transport system substrate-binding protein|nr:transport system periplasmic substrate binding protein [Gammaproteobacteria bacterium]
MQSKINYTVVGLFVLILSIILFIIPIWLITGLSNIQYKTYIVYMHESVAGLSKKADVKYNGVGVGYVKEIRLNPDNPRQVKLILDIEGNVPIHEDTVAILNTQGLTGIAYIGLKGGNPASPLLKASTKDYPVIQSAPSLLFRLDETIRHLTLSIQRVSKDMQILLSAENQRSVTNILQHLDKISGTIATNSTELDKTLKQFPQLMTRFDHTALQTQQVMNAFAEQMLPNAISELQQLTSLTAKLNQVADNIQENPSSLLRGQELPTSGPGER